MECNQVKKQLTSFLEDILSEEDTRLFLGHLEICSRCKPYVRSIGDLSNQVWKLGNIAVPDDFRSTVLFKLSHPDAPAAKDTPKPHRGIQKKYVLGGLVLILTIAAFFIKPFFLKTQKPAEMPRKAPIAMMEPIESRVDENALTTTTLEPSSLTPPLAGKAASTISSEKPGAPAEPQSPAIAQPQHWHLTYFSETDHRGEAEKRKQGLLKLQTLQGKAEALKTEISRLEAKNKPNLGQSYSEEDKKNEIMEKAERDAALNALTNQMQLLDDQIEQRQEDNGEVEKEWIKESAEKKRKETQVKAKILDTLVILDAKFQYQDEGFFIFTVLSEKLDRVLENILPIFQQVGEFQDFGGGPAGSTGQDERVSIYLDQSGVSGLHWHVGAISAAQKTKLFDAVRELGGSKDYESEESAVLSIPKTRVKDLDIRVKAMRIPVSQFGRLETEGASLTDRQAPLSDAPIKISVCFSK